MINLRPARRPIRRPMTQYLEHGTRPLPQYRPNGVSIFFRVSSNQEITTLHLHRPLLPMQLLLSCRFRFTSLIAREALVSPIVGKASFHANYLGTRERKEIMIWISRHGTCSAISNVIPQTVLTIPLLLHPLFLSGFQAHADRQILNRILYHQADSVRTLVRNTTQCRIAQLYPLRYRSPRLRGNMRPARARKRSFVNLPLLLSSNNSYWPLRLHLRPLLAQRHLHPPRDYQNNP
jgi:hypothetical protein